jgi:hypothetical protein
VTRPPCLVCHTPATFYTGRARDGYFYCDTHAPDDATPCIFGKDYAGTYDEWGMS